MPLSKSLWLPTTSQRWQTAYFDNASTGGDPFPPISYLAKRLQCFGLVVRSCSELHQITLFGPNDGEWLNQVWSVAAHQDGGRWQWRRFGPEQSFEETTEYGKRPVRLRFTWEMLVRYCDALQVPLDPGSIGPDGILELMP